MQMKEAAMPTRLLSLPRALLLPYGLGRLRSRLLGGCEFGGAGRNPLLKVLAMTFQFRCSAKRS